MATNELRDTPGRLLLGWTLLLPALVILAWRIHLHPADYEWTEYPTALGDTAYYSHIGPDDDRYTPNLKFGGGEGWFRRVESPQTMDDAVMFKLGRDATGRYLVYQPATAAPGAQPPFYLKAGENSYVEFGSRKFYRPYAPKAP
ncbi:MAG: hypothetical protein HS117_19870 [Verrucomicrobiaceae bacterium]|nr:hypothetical protein [Verrucomicrobiaceae bacterium]